MIIILLARIAWQWFPGNVYVCGLLWGAAIYFAYYNWKQTHNWGWIFTVIGLGSNFTVTILNHGYMPVVGIISVDSWNNSIWIPATSDTYLPILADHLSLYGFSIGDIFILSGLFIASAIYYYRYPLNKGVLDD